MTATLPNTCPELGIEVPVARIDHELRLLWEQDEARTNASLINLVVYSEEPGSLVRNSEMIRNLTREHACRAILVEIDREQTEPSLRAWITAHCHLAHGRKSVCSEQIAFHLTGRVTGRFRNTVFAHLNSDLPLVFWWQGELSDVLTERLVSTMDRLIVDSSSWANSAAAYTLVEESSKLNPDLIIQDHEWTRTWQFRVGVASLFDDPAAAAVVGEIDAIELSYHAGHKNAALMLLAWLAEQAKWKQRARGGRYALESQHGQPISIFLQEMATGPALSLLIIRAGDVTLSVRHLSDCKRIERKIEAPGYEVVSHAPTDPDMPHELVGLQLARGGKNSLFMKILPRFRSMLG
jgi:glucose-6-phosphate dehydrogenase assembly protein OpcA